MNNDLAKLVALLLEFEEAAPKEKEEKLLEFKFQCQKFADMGASRLRGSDIEQFVFKTLRRQENGEDKRSTGRSPQSQKE